MTRPIPILGFFGAVAVVLLGMSSAHRIGAVPISPAQTSPAGDSLESGFIKPPDAARPWVYWYFMDGNLTRDGITADLEAMKKAGIGGAIFLEVNIGIPRGPVDFMSPAWKELLRHAITEADRLGIRIALATGPGWCGAGGPWVTPEQSMQHLVFSETTASGPGKFDAVLPQPKPRPPFFGERKLSPELKKKWLDYYRDELVIAFPKPSGEARIPNADEKALYYRGSYSSQLTVPGSTYPGVMPFFPGKATFPAVPAGQCVDPGLIVDLTDKVASDGRLAWDVPPGSWTILRCGRTSTGQTTRPAPDPGLGFETDKFERSAADAHFENFIGNLLGTVGEPKRPDRGLTTLHFDSWEMGSQNWSEHFRSEFLRRRGYDPLRFLPAMTGLTVDNAEVSERFLWDLRLTAQELTIENQAMRLKELGARHGLDFSLEPYDLNPCADLTLGGVADVPQCEFWSKGFGPPTEFSCFEAVSIGHTMGRPIIAAEAFTSSKDEKWQQYPGVMKAQTDWALCTGINRFDFHRYQHQPWPDRFPGMTMGHYGVSWERTQTWWDMVQAYHGYLSRCQEMLRRGLFVADILYLAPEGAPHVFRPPPSALTGDLPDRRGYTFDGCSPEALVTRASVKDGRITFPDGMSYRLLVLPETETMTPGLLRKIKQLAEDGATIVGAPPRKSPSLVDYPRCDAEVGRLATQLWGDGEPLAEHNVGKGRIIFPGRSTLPEPSGSVPPPQGKHPPQPQITLYPDYDRTARILEGMGVPPDFESEGNGIRHIHRREGSTDIYFIANRDNREVNASCRFRVDGGRQPEWWNPLTGECRDLPRFSSEGGITTLPLRLGALESGFVVFRKPSGHAAAGVVNFPPMRPVQTLSNPWEVSFDPRWGGPAKIIFDSLEDWSKRPEPGIRNYSGKAVYRTTFDLASPTAGTRLFLSLGDVKNMAAIRLNGRDLGIVWCAPWQVEIPGGLLKKKGNQLEVTVANLWINRLIGDAALPQEKRLTWTTRNPYKPDSPLQPSGLLGPVTLLGEEHGTEASH